jgi:outer membrane lipoprotein-sorting protein
MAAGAGGDLPEVFRDWIAAQQRVSDLRVEFRMTKTLPTLKESVRSVGRFWSYVDGRFRWETGKPVRSVLVFDGITLQAWEASDNQWRKLDPHSSSMRLWMDFLGGRKLTESGLLRDFQIAGLTEMKSLTRVILEPKSPRTRRNLKQIELQFDTAEPRLVQLLVRQGDGGSQTMDFDAPRRMTAADREVIPPPASPSNP